jgi:monoamine oxidase
LTHTDNGVSVGFLDRAGLQEIEAERCVCAIPFAPLRNVVMPHSFSSEKMAAIRRLNYMAAARCCFQTASQFWKNDELGELGGLNMVATDTLAGRVWNLSMSQPNPSMGMLHSYMFDFEALQFTAWNRRERIEAMTELMRTILPGLRRDTVVAVAQKAWQEDPWQGGAWGWAPTGDLKWMYQAMRRPERNVHFAGEHTSPWIAWMNGALESADRVASEVLAAA